MRRWHIHMTFEGYQEGDSSHEAISKFKTALGLAPEALRSEVHMTSLSAQEVDEEKNSLPPDVERADVWRGLEQRQ